jgi:hypothetical protein
MAINLTLSKLTTAAGDLNHDTEHLGLLIEMGLTQLKFFLLFMPMGTGKHIC